MPAAAYRNHVEACSEVLAKALASRVQDRGVVVELLKQSYEARKIEPLRGWSAHELYDKEMALLYAVGRYGLGLSFSEYPFLAKVFHKEVAYEEAYRDILSGAPVEEALRARLGKFSQEELFRVLRLAASLVVLGLEPEEGLVKVFHKAYSELSSLRLNLFSFMRFYVALRVAEQIANGGVRTRSEKEALKLALCLRLGASSMAPPDELIRLVSKLVFRVPDRRLDRVLS
ncbi:MAG: DUF2192 domain-containing protein [Candidatus Nezhaarchaeota archaeon]|nr:DUF2192 domain-containing protein [Candidatus Nezhaarchaeota archaeon]